MLPGGAIEPGEIPPTPRGASAGRRRPCSSSRCGSSASTAAPSTASRYANGDRTRWVVTIFEAGSLSGEPRPGDDETQDVGWFAPGELDGLELSAATRLTLDSALGGVSFRKAEWLPG